ncbi:hypothetical protein [Streptomyces sp. NPDC002209]|uniref:hypothetical protein n=1 Tax=Streptomyces sp. NPDC002209 TaxID=3364638 RepID=UPI0036BD3120
MDRHDGLLASGVIGRTVVDAARVIERETAVRIVEEELDREHQKWAVLGVKLLRATVLHVEERELVWKVRTVGRSSAPPWTIYTMSYASCRRARTHSIRRGRLDRRI